MTKRDRAAAAPRRADGGRVSRAYREQVEVAFTDRSRDRLDPALVPVADAFAELLFQDLLKTYTVDEAHDASLVGSRAVQGKDDR